MSIFSSVMGMLSLLSLYLYFKIREKIKKKKSLKKEAWVLSQAQGTSAWAASCIGGRRRADFVLQEPVIHQTKGKKKGKGKKTADSGGETSAPASPTWKPGMLGHPSPSYAGYPGVIAEEDEDTEF